MTTFKFLKQGQHAMKYLKTFDLEEDFHIVYSANFRQISRMFLVSIQPA